MKLSHESLLVHKFYRHECQLRLANVTELQEVLDS